MRVLHVLEAIEGGVARYLVNVVRHVDAEHIVVVPHERVGGMTDTASIIDMGLAGARVEFLDMRRFPGSPRTLAAVPKVHRLIRRERPDIVHGHSAVGGAVARLATIGTDAARVYTPNGLHPARFAHVLERGLGRLTHCFIAASPSEAELARRLRLVSSDRIVVIPNGIDLGEPGPPVIDLREQLGAESTTLLVGSVARLAPQKAPEVFVRACSRVAASLPDARFVLVGDGRLLELVSAELAATDLGDRFLLLRDCTDAETLMSQFDVFALSSRYEGAPYTVMEAMRAGTPVVVTDVVGNRDAVENGCSGLIVPPEDPDALAEAVASLLVDPALRKEIGEAGRERVTLCFDVRAGGAALTDVYRSLARPVRETRVAQGAAATDTPPSRFCTRFPRARKRTVGADESAA